MTDRGPVGDCVEGEGGGGEDTSEVPKNIGKNDKNFLNHSPAVQHQTVFLICQQFAVQSQWTRTTDCMPFPISTVRSRNRCADYECSKCVWVLCVILVRRRAVYDRQHSIIPLKSLHQWHLSSLISVSGLLLSWKPAAVGPESSYHQATSLIGARMHMIPLFILIDDYIHKQSAVK